MAVTSPLITYEQAQLQLRQTTDDAQADILLKMAQAEAIVLDYLHDYIEDEDPTWSQNTDPSADLSFAIVQAAILEVLSNVFYHRNDGDKPIDGPLSARVVNMLRGLHLPALG